MIILLLKFSIYDFLVIFVITVDVLSLPLKNLKTSSMPLYIGNVHNHCNE